MLSNKDYNFELIIRINKLLMILSLILIHISILIFIILIFWSFQLTPGNIYKSFSEFWVSYKLSSVVSVSSAFGVSLLTLAGIYIGICRKIYSYYITPFLFKNLDNYFNEKSN